MSALVDFFDLSKWMYLLQDNFFLLSASHNSIKMPSSSSEHVDFIEADREALQIFTEWMKLKWIMLYQEC